MLFQHLAYADDLIFLCNSKEEATEKLNILSKNAKVGGLVINPTKTHVVDIRAAILADQVGVDDFSQNEWKAIKYPCPFCGRRMATEKGRKKHITTWCTGDPQERSIKGTKAEKTLLKNRESKMTKERCDADPVSVMLELFKIASKESEIYLGSLINGTSNWRLDLDRRHCLAIARFKKLKKALCARALPLSIRTKLFTISVATVLLYAKHSAGWHTQKLS
jgi:hypothetical protein